MHYYSSIDELPLKNWRAITEKGQIEHTRKNVDVGTLELDIKHDDKIQDSYLKEFGLSDDFKRILELKADIADAQCDLVIKDDRFIQNRINRLTRELKELQEDKVGADMDEIIHYLETWRKIEINEDTMSTRKFFKLVKTYQKEIERNKKK